MRAIARGHGIDSSLKGSEILDAIRVQHLSDLESKRTDAMTLYYAMVVHSEGGTVFDMISHLYRNDEIERMKEAQKRAIAEKEERERQMSLYNAMIMYANSHGGLKDDRSGSR